jgi:hypothetical protein
MNKRRCAIAQDSDPQDIGIAFSFYISHIPMLLLIYILILYLFVICFMYGSDL